MKLYRCKMLDESMLDWENCIVAVMENKKEQEMYYNSNSRIDARRKLLKDGCYEHVKEHIEFWFPYEMDGYNYSEAIAKNIPQCTLDCDYEDFEYIAPHKKER